MKLVLAATLVLALAACGGTEPETDVDSSRIVTLSGDLTEFVYALGAGERMVGVDVTTVEPQDALELPVVGVGRFITAEGVLSADPTLVLADTQSSPSTALTQVAETGVAVEVLDVPTDFPGLYDKIRELGTILNAGSEADDLVKSISADVDAAESRAVDTGLRVAYVYTRGPDVVLLFGDGMTTRPLIESAGAIDAGSASGIEGSSAVSAEALVAAAPDVIIVPSEGLEILGGVEAFLDLPGMRQTPAGERGWVLDYPEGDFLTFGPRVAESLSLLIDDLGRLGS